MKRLLLLALCALFALLPASAFAQADGSGDNNGFVLRVNGPLRVASTDRVDTAVVISDDALIQGTVENNLVVIDGDAVVTGTVEGDVVMINGDLFLRAGSRVEGDVRLIDGDLTRAPTATVVGDVNEGWRLGWWSWAFPIFFWFGATVAVVLSALIFAAVGGRQLSDAGDLLTRQPGWSILTAVLTWVGIPLVAVLVIITVIGIPFGIGMLVFLLPALLFLGYLVTGTRVGALIIRRGAAEEGRPYLAAVVGMLVFQLLALVPVLGFLLALLAALWGSGGLVLLAWRGATGRPGAPPAPAAAAPPPAPA